MARLLPERLGCRRENINFLVGQRTSPEPQAQRTDQRSQATSIKVPHRSAPRRSFDPSWIAGELAGHLDGHALEPFDEDHAGCLRRRVGIERLVDRSVVGVDDGARVLGEVLHRGPFNSEDVLHRLLDLSPRQPRDRGRWREFHRFVGRGGIFGRIRLSLAIGGLTVGHAGARATVRVAAICPAWAVATVVAAAA